MHLVAVIDDKRKAMQVPGPVGKLKQGGMWARLMVLLVKLCSGFRAGVGGVGAPRIQVLETISIGPKKQLVLVSCDDETYLIGTGPESVQAIQRIESRAHDRRALVPESGGRF